MQIESYKKEDILKLIADAKHIAVVPSKIAGTETFIAGVGLYHMLKALNKPVKLLYIGKTPDEAKSLINHEEVTTNHSKRDLVISVDYSGTHAGNVHWKNNNDVLEFRLGPMPRDFDTSKVKVNMASYGFDLIFVLGNQYLPDLGLVYSNLQDEFRAANIVNIDNTKRNTRFGVVNVIDESCDTLSLLVYKYAADWGLLPNTKSAQALLTGMTVKESKMAA